MRIVPLHLLLAAVSLEAQQPLAVPVQLSSDFLAAPTFYAGGPNLYTSKDAGATWTTLYVNPPGTPQPAITRIVVDPGNPRRIFLATALEAGGVLLSTDAGATWKRSASGLPSDSGSVWELLFAGSPPALYAAAAKAIYKSTDGAATWVKLGDLPASSEKIAICRDAPTAMYMPSGMRVYRSSDEGKTWTTAATILANFQSQLSLNSIATLAVDAVNPALLYLGVRGATFVVFDGTERIFVNSLYRSIDAGATWTTVVPQANPNYIRLDPLGRAVFYSIPEGRTVCKFASGLPRCSELSAEARSFYFLPANPDVIYASGGARIFRSTDNGESWSQLQATYRPTLAKTVDLVSTTLMPGTTTALPLEVKLMETTAQAVPFTAVPSGEPWWSVRPTSGTTPATLSLDFRATGLAEGAYTGTLRVESAATANGSVSIPLRLTVGVPPSSGAAYRIRHVAGRGTYGVSVDTGPAATSLLAGPEGLALDPSANLWIADSGSSLLRRISSDGMISIVAGQVLKPGFSGDGGPAASAQLRRPLALAFDTAGGYYVADQGNNRLRYVSSTGAIRTVAGDDRIGAANPAWYVAGVAVDRRNGGAFFASELNNRVYRVDASGQVTTLAGGGTLAAGTALQIALNKPTALSTDSAGNLYVAETGAHRIRRIDPAGLVTTIAGTGQSGFSGDNGPASAAALSAPEGVAVDPAGNVVISDTGNHRIRLVAKDGTIRTIAGIGNAGWSGDDGPGWQAQLNRPTGLAIDAKGVIYFSDTGNNRIRKLEPQTGPQVTSLVNGAGYQPEIAPGSWFVLTGIALSSTTRTWRDSEIVNGVLPTELDGVKVRINGREAAIYFISPTQINGLAPANLPEGPADVQVVRGAETSASFTATVRALSPAFFVMLAPSYAAARHHPDYKLVALPEQFPGCTAGIDCPPRPAQPGEWLLFYGTGFGPVTSAVPPLMTLPVRVRFGSTWAEGLGALASPGLYQIAVQVPEATPEGDIPVIAEVGGRQTPTVTIPVRRR